MIEFVFPPRAYTEINLGGGRGFPPTKCTNITTKPKDKGHCYVHVSFEI